MLTHHGHISMEASFQELQIVVRIVLMTADRSGSCTESVNTSRQLQIHRSMWVMTMNVMASTALATANKA